MSIQKNVRVKKSLVNSTTGKSYKEKENHPGAKNRENKTLRYYNEEFDPGSG